MSESTKDELGLDIGEREGKVVLKFARPVEEITLDHTLAKAIGQTIIDSAIRTQKGKVKTTGDQQAIKDALIMRKLKILRQRVAFRLRKLAEAGKSNAYVAEDIIEMVLSEVAADV